MEGWLATTRGGSRANRDADTPPPSPAGAGPVGAGESCVSEIRFLYVPHSSSTCDWAHGGLLTRKERWWSSFLPYLATLTSPHTNRSPVVSWHHKWWTTRVSSFLLSRVLFLFFLFFLKIFLFFFLFVNLLSTQNGSNILPRGSEPDTARQGRGAEFCFRH